MILQNKIITAAQEHTDSEVKAEEVKRVYDFFLERMSTYPLLDDNFDEYTVNGEHVYNDEQGYLAYVNDMISMALRMSDLYKDMDFSTSDLIRVIIFARIGTMGFIQQGPFESLAETDTKSKKFIRSGFKLSDVTLYALQRLKVSLTLREFDALRSRERGLDSGLSSLVSIYKLLHRAVIMNEFNKKVDKLTHGLDDGTDLGLEENEEKPWKMAKPLPDVEDAPKTEEERKQRDKKREAAKKSFDKQAEKQRKKGKAAADFDDLFGSLFEDQNLGE